MIDETTSAPNAFSVGGQSKSFSTVLADFKPCGLAIIAGCEISQKRLLDALFASFCCFPGGANLIKESLIAALQEDRCISREDAFHIATLASQRDRPDAIFIASAMESIFIRDIHRMLQSGERVFVTAAQSLIRAQELVSVLRDFSGEDSEFIEVIDSDQIDYGDVGNDVLLAKGPRDLTPIMEMRAFWSSSRRTEFLERASVSAHQRTSFS